MMIEDNNNGLTVSPNPGDMRPSDVSVGSTAATQIWSMSVNSRHELENNKMNETSNPGYSACT